MNVNVKVSVLGWGDEMGVIQEKSYLPYVEIGKLEIGKLGSYGASLGISPTHI